MPDKRTRRRKTGAPGSGMSTKLITGETTATQAEQTRPTTLPEGWNVLDDGPTTGIVRAVSEAEDPAVNRDNDRGSHRAR